MYVKYRMSKDPITISKDTTLSEALELFRVHNFHRLPVVDKQNHVIGLVTEGGISANTPSRATSLSIHELNYLLNKTKVESIMVTDVITVEPDALLEEAADIMRRKSIACLPVCKNDKLVGIITQNDIFSAFIDLMGTHQVGGRVVVEVEEDRPGEMAKIANILKEKEINISHLAVYHDEKVSVVIRVTNATGAEVASLLEEKGYKVIDIRTNK